MDRLTYRMDDGAVNWHGCITQAEMADRLAAYEDTGLKPEEVALYVKCQGESVSRRELRLGIEVAQLQAQLAEAQARERAAVEHLTLRNTMERVPCISCGKVCQDSKDYYCKNWVYCGPQEAGKGASRGAK